MKKRGLILVVFFCILAVSFMTLVSAATAVISPNTAWCYSPLDSITTFNCLSNITNYNDNSDAAIKTQNGDDGWVNTTWVSGLQLSAPINSAIVNLTLKVEDAGKQYWKIQVFNNSASSWINVSGCDYSFTSNKVYETKTCNISNYIKIASDIDSLKIRTYAYNTGGSKYQNLDYQSLIIDYNPDSIPPSFSNLTENPTNGSAYVQGQIYRFNITINETNPGSVWIEFNGTNYTNGNISNNGNFYMFNRSNLAAGSYSYKWWANDTIGNINNSGIRYYTINKAATTTNLTTTPTSPITYGTASNFSCSNSGNLNTILYINGVDKNSEKGLNVIRAAGTYIISCNSTDNQNYTGSSQQANYTINKADNTLTLLSSAGWNYNYGTESIFSCSVISGYGTPKLYIDSIEAINPITIILGADNHFIKCNISESQNYTGSDGDYQNTLTINKASSQTSLTFDKTSPQIYGTSITPSCSVISGVGTANLTLNGNAINSGQALVLGAGTWNFNCSLIASQNYTYSENVSSYIISSASTITNVFVNPGSGIDYGTASNFSCSNSNGLETILYINGVNKSNEKGLDIIRAAGDYIINCTSIENQNYSASSEQINYTINKITGDINLYLNGQENNITIDYPQQYNITATTLYGSVVIYFNGTDITANNSLNVTPARNSGYYNITAVSSGDENHSSLSITRWLNVTLDDIAPELQIISPQEGGSYGYNTSLLLNFSVADEHLDSCWYNLDNGLNITLVDCDNSTFDAGDDGIYTLYLYANDTLGNLAVKNSSFTIAVGSPTIILNSPIGIYLDNQDVTFRYTPSDSDLQSCELWGNFNGEFKLNQTHNNPLNYSENTFNLILPDGTYVWNIRCNDSLGHFVFNGNKTFYIDTIIPAITITNPIGTKNSRTGIPLQFSIIDASPSTCWYNVKYTTGVEVLGNTTINCSSTSFVVSTDGDYVLTLYAKDFANNLNNASSSFSVDTSIPVSPPFGGGGGGGGGGGSSITINQTGKLSVSQIGNIIAREGDKKTFSLNVKNIGKIFLNNCRLIVKGDISSWIYSGQKEGIAPGENVAFNLDLNIPQEVDSGNYNGEIEIRCDEGSNVQGVEVSIPGLSVINIKEITWEKGILKVNYEFDSSGIVGQSVIVEIWMVNEDGIEVKRVKDDFSVNKEGVIERNLEIDVSGLSGIYNIYFALSEDLNNFIRRSVVLGSSGTTGFAVLDSEKGKFWVYILFLLVLGVAIFFIWRRHGKEKRSEHLWLLRKKAESKSPHKLFQ